MSLVSCCVEQMQQSVWICKPQEARRHLVGNLLRFVTHKWKAFLGVAPLNHMYLETAWVGALGLYTSHVLEEEKTGCDCPSVDQVKMSGALSSDGVGKVVRKE